MCYSSTKGGAFMHLYVGTITESSGSIHGSGKGIHVLSFDGESMKCIQVIPAKQPSVIQRYDDMLYVTNEVRDYCGLNGTGGGISCYRVSDDGMIEKVNDSISYGARPSYVCRSFDHKYLFVSNHGSHSSVVCHYEKDENGVIQLVRQFDDSNVVAFELNEDGSIGSCIDLYRVEGSGYWCYGGGQSTSHLHCVKVNGRYIYTCNRGADEIEVFCLKGKELELVNTIQCPYGYAPRYMDIYNNYGCVLYENYPCVSLFKSDKDSLMELDKYETKDHAYYETYPLPVFNKKHADKDEVNTCGMFDHYRSMPSDIHICNDYVYVSNRCFQGNGSISVLKIVDDHLEFIDEYELDGKDPRGFVVSKDGKYLFVAMCDIGNVVCYALDECSGKIIREVDRIEVFGASCVAL